MRLHRGGLSLVLAVAIASAAVVNGACSSSYDTTPAAPDGGGSGNDATVGDGGPEVGTDSGSNVDAARPRIDPCATDAGTPFLVCTTFDDSMALPAGWDTDVHLTGTLGITSTDSISAPHSLEAFVPGHASGNPYQQLAYTAPQGTGTFAIELDLKASVDLTATDSSGSTAFACPIEVSTDAMPNAQVCFGKTYFGATIETYDDDAGVPGSAHQNFLTMPPALEVWHHIRVTVAFLPANGGVNVEMDGVSLGSTPPRRTVQPNVPTGMVRFDIGVDSNGHFGDARFRFDNVRITSL